MGVLYRAALVLTVFTLIGTGHFLWALVPVFGPRLLRWSFGRLRRRGPSLPKSERRRRARRDRAVAQLTAQGYPFRKAYIAVSHAERDGAYCLFTTAQEKLHV